MHKSHSCGNPVKYLSIPAGVPQQLFPSPRESHNTSFHHRSNPAGSRDSHGPHPQSPCSSLTATWTPVRRTMSISFLDESVKAGSGPPILWEFLYQTQWAPRLLHLTAGNVAFLQMLVTLKRAGCVFIVLALVSLKIRHVRKTQTFFFKICGPCNREICGKNMRK